MKHLVYILLGLMLVGVFSCRRSPGGTEARLVAIDSLITAEPDSALSLLADINADSLPADLRAYHDVLTTQALYKAYIPATTDTLIARAWSYYRDHGPYDRRIRAMLYSGTTAEELGRPDSAMRWYKRTELESRPDDHYHRAYAQEYMGILYQKCIDFPEAINKYRSAIDYFQRYDTASYLFCCQQLSQLYQNNKIGYDSARFFTNQVLNNAKIRTDSLYMSLAYSTQVKMLFRDSCFEKTKELAKSTIKEFGNFLNSDCWYLTSQSYVKLGIADSAEYYLLKAPVPSSSVDSAMFYHTKSLVFSSKGNWRDAHHYEVLSDKLAETEMLERKSQSLSTEEKVTENEYKTLQEHLNNSRLIQYSIFGIALLLIGLFFALYLMRVHRTNVEKYLRDQISWLEQNHLSEINEIENNKLHEMAATNELLMNQAHEIDKLRALQDDNDFVKTLYAQLSAIFEQNIKSLGEIASDYFQSGKNASLFMNRFSEQFKMLWSSNEVWEQIETQVNKTHNNCISRLIQIHPNLSIEERHLAMLSVLNFSSIATAICLGYKGPNVVYTKKSNLKKKLEINCSIEDYLNQLG